MANDPYLTLGLLVSASPEEVKTAWKQAARETHPDRHGNDPSASRRFTAAREAYDILSDPERRASYDHHQALRQRYGEAAPTVVKEKERPPSWWEDAFRTRAHPETLYRHTRPAAPVNHYYQQEQRDLEAEIGSKFAWNRSGVYTGTATRKANPFRTNWRNGGKIG